HENFSDNHGEEGETDNAEIAALREYSAKALLATLFFANGTPMLLAGDELGNSQQGNNNGYCQDNEITWLDWASAKRKRNRELLKFVQQVLEIFHEQPVFHRRKFFSGRAISGEQAADIAWIDPEGTEMTKEQWNAPGTRCFSVVLFGDSIDVDEEGEEISGDTLLILFNADHTETIPFTLPNIEENQSWQRLIDTYETKVSEDEFAEGTSYALRPCSMALFRMGTEEE
ncbi:MAG: glycogen debranching enzyme GlgX, partial [Planctomycetaceae bacterium]|nr:glycogen debranching enzyme GlgX [Planctomycetaceae bacterium]